MSPTAKSRVSPTKTGAITTASLLDKAKSILSSALADLETVLTKLGKELSGTKGKKHDRDGWSHHAWLTQRVAQIAGEARKLEISERASGTRLTMAQVLAFARSLAPLEREGLVRDVEAMDEEGSVL